MYMHRWAQISVGTKYRATSLLLARYATKLPAARTAVSHFHFPIRLSSIFHHGSPRPGLRPWTDTRRSVCDWMVDQPEEQGCPPDFSSGRSSDWTPLCRLSNFQGPKPRLSLQNNLLLALMMMALP